MPDLTIRREEMMPQRFWSIFQALCLFTAYLAFSCPGALHAEDAALFKKAEEHQRLPIKSGMSPALPQSRTKIILVCNTSANKPYLLGDGARLLPQKPGLSVELLRMVGRELNLEVSFQRVPWARGLFLIETNQADGIFHSSFVEERTRFGAYPMKHGKVDASRRMMTQSYVLYKRKDSPLEWTGTQIRKLAGGRVAASRGFAVIKTLRKMGVTVEEGVTPAENLRKLVHRRVAAYAGMPNLVDPVIAQSPDTYADIVRLEPPIQHKPYYLMLSKAFAERNPDLAAAIWNKIGEIRESAAFHALQKRYSD
jgi:polar amino acid transport system substrate-binding protein